MLNKIYGYGDKIVYPTLGLVGEAGEVAGKVKKILRDKNGDFSSQEVGDALRDELGDVLWYLAAVADDLGMCLEEIARRNIEKLTSRRERGVIGGSGDNR